MVIPSSISIQASHGSLPPASQSSAQSQSTNGTPQSSMPGAGMLGSLPPSDTQSLTSASVGSASTQSSSPPTYFGDQPPPPSTQNPQINTSDGQMGNSHVSSPISPHLQPHQNGFAVAGNGAGGASVAGGAVNANGQLQSYSQQQQPPQPSNGSQGTWTGQNTLSYTQSIQPSDPRASHNSYCKSPLKIALPISR